MKDLHTLDSYRFNDAERTLFGQAGDEGNGVFDVIVEEKPFFVIASNREGWEHVCIHGRDWCISWSAIRALKDMFFEQEDKYFLTYLEQGKHLDPPFFWLHLWRPIGAELPTLPRDFV